MTMFEFQSVDDLISAIDTAGDADILIALGVRIPGLLADVVEHISDPGAMIGLTSRISDAVITACLNLAVPNWGLRQCPFPFWCSAAWDAVNRP